MFKKEAANSAKSKVLTDCIEIRVRFSEVDALKMVWHGNYVKYLEDGREAFGRRYGLEYLLVKSKGYITPIIELKVEYKNPATIDDVLILETSYIATGAAKLLYTYRLYNKKDNQLVVEAQTIQLFQTVDGKLEITKPDFLEQWEHKYNLD